MVNMIAELGPWAWILLGFILLILEMVVPGVFLLWIGIAALITGLLSFPLQEVSLWGWQIQVVVFLVLSLLSAVAGKKLDRRRDQETDEPFLNRRAEQLVGRTAELEEPIRDGVGRVKLGDTTWRVSGPDLPAGTTVRIVAAQGGDLRVDKA